MNLTVNGKSYAFVPIQDFRAEYHLPETFGTAFFEPKDYTGLGSIDRAGSPLNHLREEVLDAVPRKIKAAEWLDALDKLVRVFDQGLRAINPSIGLRDPEIGFAVSGFSDVCQAVAFALIRSRINKQPLDDFRTIYMTWLNSTIRVSQTVHSYTYGDQTWSVRLVNHAYGRAGLIIETGSDVLYVYDGMLSCPAEGFMLKLLTDVAALMVAATV